MTQQTRAAVLAPVAILACLSTSQARQARTSPPVLARDWPAATLKTVLLPREAWHPMPTIADRERWTALPETLRKQILANGQQALARPIADLPATLFLEYARDGNRSRLEGRMFSRRDRLHELVLAECVENRGRFLDAVVDTIWAIAEESSWTVPAHQGAQKAGTGLPDTAEPIVDLFSAQTAHSVAWTWYLLGDRLDTVSKLVRPRMAREVDRRVLTPYLLREDFGWMGFRNPANRPNNWNPWINSNVLVSALLMEPDSGRRVDLVVKTLRSMDRYLGPYPQDGSCDEGPSYWGRAGASLFEYLELLQSASGGTIDEFADPVIANMGRFIYRVRIAGDWMADVGDSNPRGGGERALIYRYGVAIKDPLMQAFGASGATEEDVALQDRSLGRALFAVFGWADMAAHASMPAPYPRDVWLPSEDMQLMVARDRAGTSDGFVVAAWGSHNDQSHNHNDVGNAIVFVDGEPILIDVGRPTYTAQTFSNRRYEIWAMQSAFHNLPTISGVMQSAGRQFAAKDVRYTATDTAAGLQMDLAAAYPPSAGLNSWVRRVTLRRGVDVVIADRWSLRKASTDVVLNLMTPCDAAVARPGELTFTCSKTRTKGAAAVVVVARFDPKVETATIEPVQIDDALLKASWGSQLTRIKLVPVAASATGDWTLTLAKAPR